MTTISTGGALDALRRGAADVVVVEPPAVVSAIQAGLAAPLPESLSREGPAALRDRRGTLYGVPVSDQALGIAINRRLLIDAGLTPAIMRSRQWDLSPGNFAAFERLLWLLTRDRGGGHGNPGYVDRHYDYSRIVTYGLALGSDYASGLGTWATVAGLPGAAVADVNPWPTSVRLDDERVWSAIRLLRRFMVRGYIPKAAESLREPVAKRFVRGGAAMTLFEAGDVLAYERAGRDPVIFARLPFSAISSAAPIASGQQALVSANALDTALAVRAVRALTSGNCQALLADSAVALPVVRSLRSRWSHGLLRRGFDPSVAMLANEPTAEAPLISGSPEADELIASAVTRVFAGAGRSTLSEAEHSIDEALKQSS